eukprot:jgi/Bigna1/91907/estExt_fgenesh1_pg.C_1290009
MEGFTNTKRMAMGRSQNDGFGYFNRSNKRNSRRAQNYRKKSRLPSSPSSGISDRNAFTTAAGGTMKDTLPWKKAEYVRNTGRKIVSGGNYMPNSNKMGTSYHQTRRSFELASLKNTVATPPLRCYPGINSNSSISSSGGVLMKYKCRSPGARAIRRSNHTWSPPRRQRKLDLRTTYPGMGVSKTREQQRSTVDIDHLHPGGTGGRVAGGGARIQGKGGFRASTRNGRSALDYTIGSRQRRGLQRRQKRINQKQQARNNNHPLQTIKDSLTQIARIRERGGESKSGSIALHISRYGLGKRLSKKEMEIVDRLVQQLDSYSNMLIERAKSDHTMAKAMKMISKLNEIKEKFKVGKPLGGGTVWYYREGAAQFSLNLLRHVETIVPAAPRTEAGQGV